MKKIWTYKDIDAPASDVWALLSNPEHWPSWGPSLRSVQMDREQLEHGATGKVTTVVGVQLPFEITHYEEGTRWAWKVAGIDATDHSVEALGTGQCRAGFGVPWLAAPYQLICQIALQRIKTMAETPEANK